MKALSKRSQFLLLAGLCLIGILGWYFTFQVVARWFNFLKIDDLIIGLSVIFGAILISIFYSMSKSTEEESVCELAESSDDFEQAALIERIARVAHEVNRAYCSALGDDSQAVWGSAPDWQKQSAYLGVRLHLENPLAGARASHDSWSAQKISEGWVYGEVKDSALKTHPCLVSFDQLPIAQQAKDYLFRGVVLALAEDSEIAA